MVRVTVAAAFAALAGSAFAAPVDTDASALAKRANIDVDILQFALTLEHLENVFYKEAIQKFSVQDFENAGYSANYYHNLHYIAYDEQTHTEALEAAIKAAKATPVSPCTYSFPYTNVKSFITLSSILESVGTSAYLGAAPLITSDEYLTVAGAILAVEALHTSYQRASVGEIPMDNPFQTPISANSAYTLASMFITKCPPNNPKLPFTAFPYLSTTAKTCTCEQPSCGAPSHYIKAKREASTSSYGGWGWGGPGGWHSSPTPCSPPVAGTSVTFVADGSSIPSSAYVTFVNGLTVTSVKGTISNKKNISAKIPSGLSGQTYVFITKTSISTYSDSAVLYGPAILEVKPPAPTIDFNES